MPHKKGVCVGLADDGKGGACWRHRQIRSTQTRTWSTPCICALHGRGSALPEPPPPPPPPPAPPPPPPPHPTPIPLLCKRWRARLLLGLAALLGGRRGRTTAQAKHQMESRLCTRRRNKERVSQRQSGGRGTGLQQAGGCAWRGCVAHPSGCCSQTACGRPRAACPRR